MTKEQLLCEIQMLREVIREQNEEIEHLQHKLHSIELYIKGYEEMGYGSK